MDLLHGQQADLNPLDYFLWGYLKEFIYQNLIETLEELEE